MSSLPSTPITIPHGTPKEEAQFILNRIGNRIFGMRCEWNLPGRKSHPVAFLKNVRREAPYLIKEIELALNLHENLP